MEVTMMRIIVPAINCRSRSCLGLQFGSNLGDQLAQANTNTMKPALTNHHNQLSCIASIAAQTAAVADPVAISPLVKRETGLVAS
jgi:hypothetical protein